MTTLDLEPIKERLEAATPGPWEAQDFVAAPTEDAGSAVIKQGNGGLVAYALRSGAVEHEWYDKPQCDADAEFLAHAPEDILELLEEVTELHVKLDYTQFQIEEVKALHTPFIEQVGDMPPREMCSECNQPHPCPTMRALGVTE